MEEKKWWHTSGTWGAKLDGDEVFEVQSAAPGGAWIRYVHGHRRWLPAPEMDAMAEVPRPLPTDLGSKWWHAPGAWGDHDRQTVVVDLPEAGSGAWVRFYPTQVRQWMTAAELDGMAMIPAPPGVAVTDGTDRARDRREYDEAVRVVLWLRGIVIERQNLGHHVMATRIALAADQLSRCFLRPADESHE